VKIFARHCWLAELIRTQHSRWLSWTAPLSAEYLASDFLTAAGSCNREQSAIDGFAKQEEFTVQSTKNKPWIAQNAIPAYPTNPTQTTQ
jgi:hypothetical protein